MKKRIGKRVKERKKLNLGKNKKETNEHRSKRVKKEKKTLNERKNKKENKKKVDQKRISMGVSKRVRE